jgi:hypothetical protein
MAGPHLLSLGELEQLRDRLVVRLRLAQHQAAERGEIERRSHQLLERMREQPSHYKFVRLPVTDLGERGCGVWEVRPRLGLIGMLAGWWQLKLSSGCPLPGPRALGARLAIRGDKALPASSEWVGAAPDRAPLRAGPGLPTPIRALLAGRSSAEGHLSLLVAGRGEGPTLAIGHRPQGLGFRHPQLDQQFAAAALTPSVLADQ